MFVVGVSFVSLLQAVVSRCQLVSVYYLSEVAGDGSVLWGVEVELPSLDPQVAPRRMFF
uniref:Secreted protein n=1 Tax=Arundo donax TaxID=35708 RepID=A0A0A9G3U8_ARUDO